MSNAPDNEEAPAVETTEAPNDVAGIASEEDSASVGHVLPNDNFPKTPTEYLRAVAPLGPWHLVAIDPDTRKLSSATFAPDTEVQAEAWIAARNGKLNLYYHHNHLLRSPQKHVAEREDIAAMAWKHVDLDPRAGEDFAQERERILGLLTEKLPAGVPAPNVIVNSGNGYQGLWKLAEPIRIDGDLDKAEDAKRYNIALETAFRADQCHNLNRILRLPGTWNIPNEKKRAKGRVKGMASVVRCDLTFGHSIDDFPKPEAATASVPEGKAKSRRKKIAKPQSMGDVGELDRWNVPDRLKVIAVQGRHPDEPKEDDNSRSAWVYDFCCNALRCGVPQDVVLGVLLDPQFGISESVLEKGSEAEKYARRQIERAKAEGDEDPRLVEMNARYTFVADFGGKPRVVYEVWDEVLNRTFLGVQSLDDFSARFENDPVFVGTDAKGNPVMLPRGKWWRRHRKRNQRERVVFAPGRDVADAYNLWRGFACEAVAGDCDLFLAHLRDNICDGNAEHFAWLLGWMANAVQHPDRPAWSAVVLRGKRGVGKTVFADEFGALFGRHYLPINSIRHVVGNFNAHLQDVVVLFADEAIGSGDDKGRGVLNTLITESTIPIERKGVDVQLAPNFLHIIIASNDEHVVPAGADERRYFALNVSDRRAKDRAYFAALKAQMENGGRGALLHFLRTYDLSGWDGRQVPDTDALREQKERSMPAEDEFILGILEAGRVGARRPPHVGYPHGAFVSQDHDCRDGLFDLMRDAVPGLRSASVHKLGRILRQWGARPAKSGARYWVLPSPRQMREKWVAKYGPRPWTEDEPFWADDTSDRRRDDEPF